MFTALLEKLNMSANKLALEISTPGDKYSQQVISNYAIGRNKHSQKILNALAKRWPAISEAWLISGEGEIFPTGRYNEKPEAQLPPQVPSEAKPQPSGLPALPGTATPQEIDFISRLLRQYEEQIAGYQEREAQWEAREAWYQEMLKKPLASSDAAAFMFAEPATPISLRPTACLPVSAAVQPTVTAECVVREMWPKQEQQALAA
jgi:hypothetical protein